MAETNFLQETETVLKRNGKSINDILYGMMLKGDEYGDYQGKSFYFSRDDFINLAKNTNYDRGYGHHEIVQEIKLVGKNFWLERHEYDGSEWWEFKTKPKKPKIYKKPKHLFSNVAAQDYLKISHTDYEGSI